MFFLLYIRLAYLILLLRLFVDLDDRYVHCMIACFMTTILLFDCMSCLFVWETHLSLISNSLVSVDFVSFVFVFVVWLETCCSFLTCRSNW